MSLTPPNRPAPAAGLSGLLGTQIAAALATMFNFLVLNLVLLIASLPVITLPAAVNAAGVALDRWRGEGEDRVVREFLIALRSGAPLQTTVVVGVPLAVAAAGVAEVRHFARGGGLAGRASLAGHGGLADHAGLAGHGGLAGHAGLVLSLSALLIILTALGYVFLLAARDTRLSAAESWSLCARLAIRNLPVAGPLMLAEIAGAAVLTAADPALLLLGIPLFALDLMRLTARPGLRRALHEGTGPEGAGPEPT
jgi:hypothetical protein